MTVEIYVGNLSYDTTEDTLKKVFSNHEIASIRLVTDEATGRSKGFGFIELSGDQAESAIETLNGVEVDGRNIKVGESRPHRPRNRGRSFDDKRGQGRRGRD